MTNPRPEDDHASDHNPLEEIMRNMGLIGPGESMPSPEQLMGKLHGQFSTWQHQMSSMFGTPTEGQSANWALVKDTARQAVTTHGLDPTPTHEQARDIADASDLVNTWLNAVTDLPAATTATAISRAEWIEATTPVWSRMAEPIVSHIAEALGTVLTQDQHLGALPLGGDFLAPMVRQAAAAMFAGHMGKALGDLAAATISMTDIGLPLAEHPGLLPRNIAAFSEGLDISQRDLNMYLTLREMARHRLFSTVAWLGPQIIAYIEHYAREIRIDASALEDAVTSLESFDTAGLEQLSVTINGKLFNPEKTPEQVSILARLEVLLALVEGWVDHIVNRAGAPWLTQLPALEELVRRRRAEGGPSQTALVTLVGLELRPRRIREATNLWAAVENARGAQGRDDVWKHPDLLPDADALSDPLGWITEDTHAPDDLDRELEKLLGGEE